VPKCIPQEGENLPLLTWEKSLFGFILSLETGGLGVAYPLCDSSASARVRPSRRGRWLTAELRREALVDWRALLAKTVVRNREVFAEL